ncbi:MAG: phytanoyl-CoA dioxygenase family protein [Planctomycetes bacterium]|nr:phytanoyl-CoA dioxygenase family protein [Planctomycetota bacterium]
MHYQQEKQDYDRDGFVIVRQFLTGHDLDELRDSLHRYIRDVVPTLPDSAAFYQDRSRPETLKQMQHMDGDVFFRDYTKHWKWVELAEALVGEPAAADSPEWFNKPPGTVHVTPPHQDNYYFCLAPSSVVTIWLALDPVQEANGCLRYVRGSHLRGFRAHAPSNILGFSQGITDYGRDDLARETQIHLQPGDAVAHHGMTIHRADPNRSPTRHRRAFAIVFKGVNCKRDEAAFARYMASVKTQHESMGLQTSTKDERLTN